MGELAGQPLGDGATLTDNATVVVDKARIPSGCTHPVALARHANGYLVSHVDAEQAMRNEMLSPAEVSTRGLQAAVADAMLRLCRGAETIEGGPVTTARTTRPRGREVALESAQARTGEYRTLHEFVIDLIDLWFEAETASSTQRLYDAATRMRRHFRNVAERLARDDADTIDPRRVCSMGHLDCDGDDSDDAHATPDD